MVTQEKVKGALSRFAQAAKKAKASPSDANYELLNCAIFELQSYVASFVNQNVEGLDLDKINL